MTRILTLFAFLAACTTGDTGTGTPKDAPTDTGSGSGSGSADAAVSHVSTVTCPATVAGTVTTTDANMRFDPMNTTIPVGGIVKFVMSPTHNVEPNPIAPLHDPGTVVDFGATTCLKFDAAGTYGIYCATHSFAGTITVQ